MQDANDMVFSNGSGLGYLSFLGSPYTLCLKDNNLFFQHSREQDKLPSLLGGGEPVEFYVITLK